MDCPICNKKLVKKHEGYVCTNSPNNCKIAGFKCGIGWCFIPKKQNNLFWTLKYDFDINRHENTKEWLMLKSIILYEKGCCEICGSDRFLQVHHILSRHKHPELALDKENLMVLCKDCHKKIHENDKYKFGSFG